MLSFYLWYHSNSQGSSKGEFKEEGSHPYTASGVQDRGLASSAATEHREIEKGEGDWVDSIPKEPPLTQEIAMEHSMLAH